MAPARVLLVLALSVTLGGRSAAVAQSAPVPGASPKPGASEPSLETVARKAAAARDAGRLDEAISLYRKGVALEPKWAEGRWYLGTLLYDKDAFAAASEVLRPLVTLTPQSGPAWAFLGLSEFRLKQYGPALAHIEKGRGLGLGGSDALIRVARYHAAILQTRLSRFDAATELLAGLARSQDADGGLRLALGLVLLRRPLLPSEVPPAERDLVDKAGSVAYSQATGRIDDAQRGFEELREGNGDAPGVTEAYRVFLGGYAKAFMDPDEREQAGSRFRARLSSSPEDFESNLYLGLLLADRAPAEAAACLERATAARPDRPEAAYALASLRLAAGRPDEARALLEEVLSRAPAFSEAHALLASVYDAQDRKADADRERQAVRDRRPSAGEGQTPVVDGPDAGRGPGAGRFDVLAQQAGAAREGSHLDDAVRLYRQALTLRPSWEEGLWYLGTLQFDLGQMSEARESFQKLVNLKPEGGAGWAYLGLCEFRLKDYGPALDHLQRGHDLGLGGNESLSHNVKYFSSILLARLGEFEWALRDLTLTFAAFGNDSPSIIEALGVATLRMALLPEEVPEVKRALVAEAGRAAFYQGARRLVEARRAFDELLRRYPEEPSLHYAYGVFLLSEEPDRALEEFRRELRVSPGHVFARLQLAFEYLKRGDHEAALPFAEEAVKLDPRSFAGRNALGRALLEKGDLARGTAELEAGAKLAPDSAEMQFALARAYSRSGRKEEAEKARAEFVRLQRLASSQTQAAIPAAARKPGPEPEPESSPR
jgi:tetratricopeptide (TPR) repeat protein